MQRTLSELLGVNSKNASLMVSGLTADSRLVSKGFIFAALSGSELDGRDFIDSAIKAGASAILTQQGTQADFGTVPVIEDKNPRRKYAEMAAAFYGRQPEAMVAVTGTNGKTSVADFTRQIWELNGLNAASLGTIGVRSKALNLPGGLTTPDPMTLYKDFYALAEAGVSHACVEASSHGLDQYRLDGIKLDAAAFTNLTRDHLDYHHNETSYFYAKARLFGELLAPKSTAVVNIASPYGKMVDDLCWGRGLKRLTVGYDDTASFSIRGVTLLPKGQKVTTHFDGKDYTVNVPLVGGFQIENALLAVGLATATGIKPQDALASLENLVGVSGRMEYMGASNSGGSVYVDFAHTPAGLETVLTAARAHKPAKLSVVFGCGGNRDTGKRPIMGEIAARLADSVVIADDNPRHEDAALIREEIKAACPNAIVIGDRRTAIEEAIKALQDGDMLIIAGKGHENGQIVGDDVLPHSDLDIVAELLSSQVRLGGMHG